MGRLLDIAIVGYGTAGQAAAVCLSRAGHRLQVFERSLHIGPVGAGVLLQPTGITVLRELGLLDQALVCGAVVQRLYGTNCAERVVMEMRYRDLDSAYFGLGLQRGALFQLLRNAYSRADQIHTGCDIRKITPDGRSLLDTQGNRHGPFDLIIASDGASSPLRTSLTVSKYDKAYPWGALWCLCSDIQHRFDGVLLQRYDRARRMAGILPVGRLPDESSSEQRVSFFWSLPIVQFSAWEAQGLEVWKKEVIAYWSDTAGLLECITQQEQLARATYRDVVLHQYYHDRVVFLGDSAHAMSPQLGQGANMALLDARELAYALDASTSVEKALSIYNFRRKEHIKIYQFMSRWLTLLFQSHYDFAAWCRDLFFYPLGRAPFFQDEMLKILTGVKSGWFGKWRC